MNANCAFLAGLTLLLVAFVSLDELQCLVPYKRLIFEQYLWTVVGGLLVLFFNLFAFFYLTGRALFLKDTGRKLAHIEKLLRTPDTIVRDLSDQLAKRE